MIQLLAAIEHMAGRLAQNSEQLLQIGVSEKTLSDQLSCLLRDAGYRAASQVNVWQLVKDLPRFRKSVTMLKTFRHPLQPDVDLLIEDHRDGGKLWGFEIKIIRWRNTLITAVPKARHYDGLGPALAVAIFGVDYACLFHIFIPPMAAYRALETRDPQLAEQFDDDRIEFTAAYNGIIKGILEHFNLPIGYISMGVFLDQATKTVGTVALNKPWKLPRALAARPTGSRIRPLLVKALGLIDEKKKHGL